MKNQLMKYFGYNHLPMHLQPISKAVASTANYMETVLPDGAEKTAGLRKLLEAKDCFVRASLDMPKEALEALAGKTWHNNAFLPDGPLSLEEAAVRYAGDGEGYLYIDNGSGSDWKTRHPDGELLYALAATKPTTWYDRLVEEAAQLDDRLNKLNAWVGTHDFNNLDSFEQADQLSQRKVFEELQHIYQRRINRAQASQK